jgi:SagB-type dehydrogenase family enzyme
VTESFFLSLREGTSFTPRGDDEVVLQQGASASAFRCPPAGTLRALRQIASTGEYEDRLIETVLKFDGFEALARFYYFLHFLGQARLLRRSVHQDGDRLATLVPISSYFEYPARAIVPGRRYQISRFAYSRVVDGETMLESPVSCARILLHDWRVAKLIHELAKPIWVDELDEQIANVPVEAAKQLMTLMLNGGMLTELNAVGKSDEHENPALRSWEFHDLLFHSRSRQGRHDHPVGGTYRLAGQLDPPPALKSVCSETVIPLRYPDLERRKREDPPFELVHHQRCSIRKYDTKPITLPQLAEFLYRVAGVTDCDSFELDTPGGPVQMDFAHRPYPSGGALYELELYLTVKTCEGLGAGLYRYDGKNHQLEQLSDLTGFVQKLLLGASHATQVPFEHLQVLIIIAARFQRLSWKYSSMAYAVMLKDAGVLYQTMYLVAAAMGLAPCGVGCGDADLFARAAKTNYYEETSIGEFLLGSRGGNASDAKQ